MFSWYLYILVGSIDMKKEQSLYDELISKNKYNILRSFLEKNKNDILKALNDKVRYIHIYEVFIERTQLDIDYKYLCQFISEFKKKYIYNLTEAEYKKQMQAISQAGITTPEKKVEIEQPKILAAKISESEQPVQPKEQEKAETKKDVPADEKPSGKIPKWKEAGFNSLNEYFKYLKSQPKSMELKEEFIWKPT